MVKTYEDNESEQAFSTTPRLSLTVSRIYRSTLIQRRLSILLLD